MALKDEEKKEDKIRISLDDFCKQVSENTEVPKEDVEKIIQTFVDYYIKDLNL